MKTIVIDARQYTSSTGRYTYRLIQYLQEIDKKNKYIILLKPSDLDKALFSNSNFSKLGCPYKEFTFSEQYGFLKQLNTLKADLVHFGMVQQPLLYRGKRVTTIHDLTTVRFNNPAKNLVIYKIKQQIYKYVIKYTSRKSKAIITPTNYIKDDLVKFSHINPNKITVTLESADPITDPPEKIKNLIDRPFIMYVGRPTPHKNLEKLIDAFILLRQTHKHLILVLAGKKDANYQRIENNLPDIARPYIYFTDFVSEGQLRWLYENCQAYIFPSLSEGFGLPGLEAMAHSAAVVSSNSSCLPEVYGSAAHYFNPNSAEDMRRAINDVLTNPKLKQKLINLGHEQLVKYSWKTMAQQTLDIYNKVLSS